MSKHKRLSSLVILDYPVFCVSVNSDSAVPLVQINRSPMLSWSLLWLSTLHAAHNKSIWWAFFSQFQNQTYFPTTSLLSPGPFLTRILKGFNCSSCFNACTSEVYYSMHSSRSIPFQYGTQTKTLLYWKSFNDSPFFFSRSRILAGVKKPLHDLRPSLIHSTVLSSLNLLDTLLPPGICVPECSPLYQQRTHSSS